jgi:hypothetical protein
MRSLRHAETGLNRVADRFIAAGHVVPSRKIEDLIRAFDVHIGTPDEVIESLAADTALAA